MNKQFRRLATNLDFSNVLAEVEANEELFEKSSFRQNFKASPFVHTQSIACRLTYETDMDPDMTETELLYHRARKGVRNLNAIDTSEYAQLPAVYNAVMNLASAVKAEQIGRVLVAKLFPGGEIKRHRDYGPYHDYYDRFHIVLGGEGCFFRCENEVVKMLPGDVWTFNDRDLHEVWNDSDSPRIHIVIDFKLKGERVARWPEVVGYRNNVEFIG